MEKFRKKHKGAKEKNHQNYSLLGKHLVTALLAVTKKKVVKRTAFALNRPLLYTPMAKTYLLEIGPTITQEKMTLFNLYVPSFQHFLNFLADSISSM